MTNGDSSFDEIENAFDRVSSVADALLDSIRDDSLRGRQRRESRRRASRYDYSHHTRDDFDDDDDDDNDSLCESVDASLIHDMKNLKSVTQLINQEIEKEGRAFRDNIKADNGKFYLEKLQVKAERESTTMDKLKIKTSSDESFRNGNQLQKPAVRPVDREKKKSNSKSSIASKESLAYFVQQIQSFFNPAHGKDLRLPLLIANVFAWIVIYRLVNLVQQRFVSEQIAFAPLMEPTMDTVSEDDVGLEILREDSASAPLGSDVNFIQC